MKVRNTMAMLLGQSFEEIRLAEATLVAARAIQFGRSVEILSELRVNGARSHFLPAKYAAV